LRRFLRGRYVERIFEDYVGKKVAKAKRFLMGLTHYVFDVVKVTPLLKRTLEAKGGF
jgi:hypothetical protein